MGWLGWALASAAFAALTAVFGKIGVTGVQSDYATFLRTLVIVALIAAVVTAGGHWRSPADLPGRSLAFIGLSGLATGASWLCYYRALQLGQAAQVAPIDKLSVVLVAVFGVSFLQERLSAANWAGIALIASGTILVA
ncbi:EamA family transporter [uncultured Aureimonas sp.]|uniref:EamA family transporter n=1 Tax=uncultured Aureimonas sp. TaxID=1604662 RepID=UPI0025F14223|nr:EamA family transporter [uncultured Aureimonas sp.]